MEQPPNGTKLLYRSEISTADQTTASPASEDCHYGFFAPVWVQSPWECFRLVCAYLDLEDIAQLSMACTTVHKSLTTQGFHYPKLHIYEQLYFTVPIELESSLLSNDSIHHKLHSVVSLSESEYVGVSSYPVKSVKHYQESLFLESDGSMNSKKHPRCGQSQDDDSLRTELAILSPTQYSTFMGDFLPLTPLRAMRLYSSGTRRIPMSDKWFKCSRGIQRLWLSRLIGVEDLYANVDIAGQKGIEPASLARVLSNNRDSLRNLRVVWHSSLNRIHKISDQIATWWDIPMNESLLERKVTVNMAADALLEFHTRESLHSKTSPTLRTPSLHRSASEKEDMYFSQSLSDSLLNHVDSGTMPPPVGSHRIYSSIRQTRRSRSYTFNTTSVRIQSASKIHRYCSLIDHNANQFKCISSLALAKLHSLPRDNCSFSSTHKPDLTTRSHPLHGNPSFSSDVIPQISEPCFNDEHSKEDGSVPIDSGIVPEKIHRVVFNTRKWIPLGYAHEVRRKRREILNISLPTQLTYPRRRHCWLGPRNTRNRRRLHLDGEVPGEPGIKIRIMLPQKARVKRSQVGSRQEESAHSAFLNFAAVFNAEALSKIYPTRDEGFDQFMEPLPGVPSKPLPVVTFPYLKTVAIQLGNQYASEFFSGCRFPACSKVLIEELAAVYDPFDGCITGLPPKAQRIVKQEQQKSKVVQMSTEQYETPQQSSKASSKPQSLLKRTGVLPTDQAEASFLYETFGAVAIADHKQKKKEKQKQQDNHLLPHVFSFESKFDGEWDKAGDYGESHIVRKGKYHNPIQQSRQIMDVKTLPRRGSGEINDLNAPDLDESDVAIEHHVLSMENESKECQSIVQHRSSEAQMFQTPSSSVLSRLKSKKKPGVEYTTHNFDGDHLAHWIGVIESMSCLTEAHLLFGGPTIFKKKGLHPMALNLRLIYRIILQNNATTLCDLSCHMPDWMSQEILRVYRCLAGVSSMVPFSNTPLSSNRSSLDSSRALVLQNLSQVDCDASTIDVGDFALDILLELPHIRWRCKYVLIAASIPPKRACFTLGAKKIQEHSILHDMYRAADDNNQRTVQILKSDEINDVNDSEDRRGRFDRPGVPDCAALLERWLLLRLATQIQKITFVYITREFSRTFTTNQDIVQRLAFSANQQRLSEFVTLSMRLEEKGSILPASFSREWPDNEIVESLIGMPLTIPMIEALISSAAIFPNCVQLDIQSAQSISTVETAKHFSRMILILRSCQFGREVKSRPLKIKPRLRVFACAETPSEVFSVLPKFSLGILDSAVLSTLLSSKAACQHLRGLIGDVPCIVGALQTIRANLFKWQRPRIKMIEIWIPNLMVRCLCTIHKLLVRLGSIRKLTELRIYPRKLPTFLCADEIFCASSPEGHLLSELIKSMKLNRDRLAEVEVKGLLDLSMFVFTRTSRLTSRLLLWNRRLNRADSWILS